VGALVVPIPVLGVNTAYVSAAIVSTQYRSRAYAQLCDRFGVIRSMGAVGTSADNALAEAFNATLKRETLAGAAGWDSPTAARRAVFAWTTHFNTRRRPSTLRPDQPHHRREHTQPICVAERGVGTYRVSMIKRQGPPGRTSTASERGGIRPRLRQRPPDVRPPSGSGG
jgi:hypothetical protein